MPPHTIFDLGIPDTTGGLYVPIRLRGERGLRIRSPRCTKMRFATGLNPPNQNPAAGLVLYVRHRAPMARQPDLGPPAMTQALPDDTMPPTRAPRRTEPTLSGPAVTADSAETYLDVRREHHRYDRPVADSRRRAVTELIRFFWYTSAGSVGYRGHGDGRARHRHRHDPSTRTRSHRAEASSTCGSWRVKSAAESTTCIDRSSSARPRPLPR